MAQTGYTPIQLYHSTTASAAPTAGNLANGELAINITDGKLYYKDNGGNVQLLASKAGAAGDVVGPASATDNALVRFDATTGKLVQNSVGILSDTGDLSGIAALSMSGALTLSGGTANGVAYLNASKVLTTGSALTFDGTRLRTVGYLYVNSDTDYLRMIDAADSTYIARITRNGSNIEFWNRTGGGLIFGANDSEQMRLTSTGLGIGTSSPNCKFEVKGGSAISTLANSYTNAGMLHQYSSSILLAIGSDGTNPVLQAVNATNNTAKDITLQPLGGNLGLGVTPSAWGSGWIGLQIGAGAGLVGRSGVNNQVQLVANAYYNGTNWIYKNTDSATQYFQTGGYHAWGIAPSGTAGNAISFTQAMTLDASGNLVLGDTSATGRLSVVGNYAFFRENASGADVYIRGYYGNSNVAAIQVTTNSPLAFVTNNTERARITSSGDLRVGTTNTAYSATERLSVTAPSGSGGIGIATPNSNVIGLGIYSGYTATGTATAVQFQDHSSIVRGSITVTTSATAYNTSSDYRLKENIAPMTGALAKVAQLKPCTYKWKADGSDGEGFIAHELQEVCPQAVTGEKDAVDAEGKPVYQGIDTSFLVATLTAAIQELKAEFDAYKATHP